MLNLLLAFELPNVFHQLCVHCIFFWQGPVEGGLSWIQPGFSDPLIWHHFFKKNMWETETQMGNWLVLCSETWPIQTIYFTDEETDPHSLRVHTGANVDLGLQLMSYVSQFQLISTMQHCILNCPHADLYPMPQNFVLPWQTLWSQAPGLSGTSEVPWVSGLSVGWQILLGTMANQRAYILFLTQKASGPLCRNIGPIWWQHLVLQEKPDLVFFFVWNFLCRTGQRKHAYRWTFASTAT